VQISAGEIPDGEQELPCRIVIDFTTTEAPDRLRVTVVLILQYDL
jgi:hypothetical protein